MALCLITTAFRPPPKVPWSRTLADFSFAGRSRKGRTENGAHGTLGKLRLFKRGPEKKLVFFQKGREKVDMRNPEHTFKGQYQLVAKPLPRSWGESVQKEERSEMQSLLRDALLPRRTPAVLKDLPVFSKTFRSKTLVNAGLWKGPPPLTFPCSQHSKVTISGTGDKPKPVESFVQLGLVNVPPLVRLILEGEGWKHPTTVQGYVWSAAAALRDVVALSPAGSGKTVAYLIPACQRAAATQRRNDRDILSPTSVILVPSRELARQVHKLALKIAHGFGVTVGLVAGRSGEVSSDAALLVATPKRLLSLVRKDLATLRDLKVLVVDEADLILTKHEQLVQTIRVMATGRDGLQVLMASSTWTPSSAEMASPMLDNPVVVRVGGDDLPSIQHHTHVVHDDDKTAFLLLMFQKDVLPVHRGEKYIVFTKDAKTADQLFDILAERFPARQVQVIHEQRPVPLRDDALGEFCDGPASILVSTDLCSRGVHVHNVRGVVNYDLPDGFTTLQHRIGRTGRGFQFGVVHTLLSPSLDRKVIEGFIEFLKQFGKDVPAVVLDLVRPEGTPPSWLKSIPRSTVEDTM